MGLPNGILVVDGEGEGARRDRLRVQLGLLSTLGANVGPAVVLAEPWLQPKRSDFWLPKPTIVKKVNDAARTRCLRKGHRGLPGNTSPDVTCSRCE